jgi:hypothetical protein
MLQKHTPYRLNKKEEVQNEILKRRNIRLEIDDRTKQNRPAFIRLRKPKIV